MRGCRRIGGDHDRTCAQRFATVQREFVFAERFGVSVETNGVRRKQRGELRWNRAHAASRYGGVTLREHFENEFEHAAGGLQFAIQKNAAEKRPEEAVDKFVGESGGTKSILC